MRMFTTYTKRKLERFAYNYCVYIALACSLFGLLYISLTSKDSLSFDNDEYENANVRVAEEHAEPLKRDDTAEELPRIGHRRTFVKADDLLSGNIAKARPEYDRVFLRRKQKADNAAYAYKTTENITLKINKSAEHPEKLYFYTNIIVHFDLKGAPPKLNYFLELLDLVAKSGATGVLLEWEDMFPWDGALKSVRSTDAYSKKDVETILRKATSLGLNVIPLVQTFGHLEWILKYEKFRSFRENDKYPQVVCIGDQEAVKFVKEAVRQVAVVHKPFGLKYFHIGADEAFEYGTCHESVKQVQKLGSPEKLAIKHLAAIANYAKSITKGATILAWHDMLKKFNSMDVEEGGLGKLIEPVIWDYSENLQGVDTYSVGDLVNNFGKFWASSAFKGADSPTTKYNRFEHYESNNIQWVKTQRQLRQEKETYNPQGIIITGWSRFDHMAGLCEIWPVSEPTMVLNVQVALIGAHQAYEKWDPKTISRTARESALRILGCQTKFGWLMNGCLFPGVDVYLRYQEYYREAISRVEHDLGDNYQIKGWLSEYNIRHGISQNWYLKEIKSMLLMHRTTVEMAAKKVRAEMLKLFHNSTVDEFFFANIDPLMAKIDYYLSNIAKLQKIDVQKRRQFKIEGYNSSLYSGSHLSPLL